MEWSTGKKYKSHALKQVHSKHKPEASNLCNCRPKVIFRGTMDLTIKAILILGLALISFRAEGKQQRARRALVDGAVFDVTKYGARADGRSESSLALIRAWNAACKSTGGPATLLIPSGDFMAGEVVFQGPCTAKPITIQLQGNLLSRTDLSLYTRNVWISVENVDGLIITGGGTFNGQGEASWKHSVKGDTDNHLPVSIQFAKVTNALVKDVNLLNSKGFHMKITSGSEKFTVQNLAITAPGDSPNTDGIHISKSREVNITDTKIGTGDDCISIGDGNTDVFVSKITCGPGHGISVGSLGKRETETDLKGVTVTNCTLIGTTNGARIKTYRASPQLQATTITYEDIIMDNVQNPIIIDQNYSSKNKREGSNVKVSDVHFKNIRGTSASGVAVALHCSDSNPCEDVELVDIDLTLSAHAKGGPISSACENAKATFTGKQSPEACAA